MLITWAALGVTNVLRWKLKLGVVNVLVRAVFGVTWIIGGQHLVGRMIYGRGVLNTTNGLWESRTWCDK